MMATTPRTPAVRINAADLGRGRRPGAPAKLAHIVLKTPRPTQMTEWYRTVLDAIVVFGDKRITFLTYDDEHHRIALVHTPALLRIPGLFWALHRKFWGVDHVAFTYHDLGELIAVYRRLARVGINPVWCINHGPTTSMYYEDPDGNRLELQVDNFASNLELLGWLESGEFADNPIGVEFDPDVLERRLRGGVSIEELGKRGSAPPDGRPPRSGLRTIRWKTL
jgi:catechol 2,3-dioxygenase-like lactoylglutathione lyase family enzyme